MFIPWKFSLARCVRPCFLKAEPKLMTLKPVIYGERLSGVTYTGISKARGGRGSRWTKMGFQMKTSLSLITRGVLYQA